LKSSFRAQMISEPFKPDLFSKIVRGAIAPLWAWKERSPYLNHLKKLEKAHHRSYDQVRQTQWTRLGKLLNHAYENCDYYHARMKSTGLEPKDFRDWEDLQRLPLLTKEDIRKNKSAMVAKSIPLKKLISGQTSGSTGISLEFYVDEDSQQWKRACTVLYDQWSGWKLGERIGAIWGNPQHQNSWRARLRNLLLERFSFLDTLQMDEPAMMHFYDELLRKRPTLLFGHAHSLYLFAQFLENKKLAGIHPRGIISTCMVLHPFERQKIEKIFDCKVTNRYGCEEVSLIACECSEHEGMHLNYDSLIVEFIRNGKAVKAGEPGAIVITDLTNYGMPFIRYKVGDVGIPTDRTCPCGCAYPLMESIEGRVADYIKTPEGILISGISLTENFALQLPGIKQMQIIQEEIDFLIFRLVKGENFEEAVIQDLDQLVRKRFGEYMRYKVDYEESIQSEDSGKYRFCISKVPNPFYEESVYL
jgi:phenylacetate-CoA ligase